MVFSPVKILQINDFCTISTSSGIVRSAAVAVIELNSGCCSFKKIAAQHIECKILYRKG